MRDILLLIFLTFTSFSYATNGGTVGNGGDIYAIQFIEIAKDAADILANQHEKSFSIKKFREAIDSTVVDSTDEHLFLNGIKKDAINYPDHKRIIFNRKAWIDNTNDRTRMLFVLHEYLGIMKIEDSRYSVSTSLLKEIIKDSLVCKSVVQNAYTDFAITGNAVVSLKGKDELKWSDEFHTYMISINSFNKLSFFTLTVFDLNLNFIQRVTGYLHRSKPIVNLNFAISTNKKLNGYPIKDVVIECH